jgi:hypothetical protein
VEACWETLSRHPTTYDKTKLRRRNSHDPKTYYCSSHCTVLYAGVVGFLPGTSGTSKKDAGRDISRADLFCLRALFRVLRALLWMNIDAKSKKSPDGKFHVKHEGQDLALDLIKVHDDRLQDLGGSKYFACVDMKATDGKTYDIDFFLTGQPGKMKVTETSVHKIDGKPLYNWKEENGTWHKVPAS